MANNNCTPVKVRTVIDITDPEYFCNKSWTLSHNFNTNSWISFHTYIPNWYIGENNFFYSGLNGGCDLEAIAGEPVPYTTTSTTTLFPVTTTTTSTTTSEPDCTLTPGTVVELDCTLVPGSALEPTTTTTSTSSTTTTTTTVCVGCSTYLVSNDLNEEKTLVWTDCGGNSFPILFGAYESLYLCACPSPTPEIGFSMTYAGIGCFNCFCYTFTNTTEASQEVLWADCDNNSQSAIVAADKSLCVCAIYGSAFAPEGVTVVGGSVACSTNNECGIPFDPSPITETMVEDCPTRIYTYSVTSIPPGATGLVWSVPPGVSILSEAATSITVSIPSGGASGNVSVYATSECGNSALEILPISFPACTTTTTTTLPPL